MPRRRTPPPNPPQPPPAAVQRSPLETLASRRTGGAEAIKGFICQVRYVVHRMLTELPLEEGGEGTDKRVRLEGLEDVDFLVTLTEEGAEAPTSRRQCLQVKASGAKWNADSFWRDGILQNFLEAYLLDPTLTFRVVHTAPLPSRGSLAAFAKASRTGQPLTRIDFNYWKNHLNFHRENEGSHLDWTGFSVADFLKQITFEHIQEAQLESGIRQQVTTHLAVPQGQEGPYVNALLWSTLNWSRQRREVTAEDIHTVVNEVTEDIRRGVEHVLIRKRWLESVSFAPGSTRDEEAYFEGTAARPSHIAAELPVVRDRWFKEIRETFDQNDVTVIRASSGQGKSTLAWQLVRELVDEGWTPYELSWCNGPDQIMNVIEFLELRVQRGEMPLVVLDGLRPSLEAWVDLVNRTEDLPVKYIVTSREEDWYRFGGDPDRLPMKPVFLEMSEPEAKAIYNAFRQKGKIHPKAPRKWRSAWEKVKETGLLIEFVYLITSGEMLKDRIDAQVKALSKESDSGARLEILRLVSLADVLGLSLPVSELLAQVHREVGFQGDRGEALESLYQEYYLSPEGDSAVRGLHPIRSRHLVKRLHRRLPLVDTLIGLISLIQPDDVLDFCAQAPFLLATADQSKFFDALAEHFSEKPYAEILSAVDGTFVADACSHLSDNRSVYDEIFRSVGSTIHIFSSAVVPKLVGNYQKQEVSHLSGMLPPFDPSDSLTVQFLRSLYRLISDQTPSLENPVHVGLLAFWFSYFDLPDPILTAVDTDAVCRLMRAFDIRDLRFLFFILPRMAPDQYERFIATYRRELLDRFCESTDTLRVWEEESSEGNRELHIEYFVDNRSPSIRTDSMTRLAMLYPFFPHYDVYRAKELYMPFSPTEHTVRRMGDSLTFTSAELMPIADILDLQMRILWMRGIAGEYQLHSLYEWQQQLMDLRRRSVDMVKALCGFLSSVVRMKDSNRHNRLSDLDYLIYDLVNDLLTMKQLRSPRDPELPAPFVAQQIILNDWIHSWMSFLNLFRDFFDQGFQDSSILRQLRKTAKTDLPAFQSAYREILDQSSSYFDPAVLETEEQKWYERLDQMVVFYRAHFPIQRAVSNPREAARRWLKAQERQTLDSIRGVLDEIASSSDAHFILADTVIDDPPSKKVVFGLQVGPSGEIPDKIVEGLSELADLDVNEFCLHLIDEEGFSIGSYFNFLKSDLRRFQRYLAEERRFAEGELEMPFERPVDPEWIALLPGVKLKPFAEGPVVEAFDTLLVSIWKLGEVRQRLEDDPNSSHLKSLDTKLFDLACDSLAAFQERSRPDALRMNRSMDSVPLDAYVTSLSSHVAILESMLSGDTPISNDALKVIADRLF